MATVSSDILIDTKPPVSHLSTLAPMVSHPTDDTPLALVDVTASHKQVEAKHSSPPKTRRERLMPNGINWPIMGWIVVLHLGALAAPFTFSWQGLALVVVLHWLTGGIGICLGYHRLFTHSSFETYRPLRWLIAWIGGLAGEGGAIDWVSNHRKHHALSDQEGDPHSPHDGPWWSHMFWFARKLTPELYNAHVNRWVPDLLKDPVLRFLGQTFLLWHFVIGGVLFGAGYLVGGTYMGWSFLVWGLFVRLVLVLHSTWFVNSASHMWGYINYKTTDDSRNNWWVALITYGEGWHNNHHAYPRMANHGHKWWELDVTFWTIRLMQRLGLAWDVVDYKRKPQESRAKAKNHSDNSRQRVRSEESSGKPSKQERPQRNAKKASASGIGIG
jgi:fatty-acid desaturase